MTMLLEQGWFVLNFLIPKVGSRQWKKFFRTQVMIDLSRPLVVGFFRTEACGERRWIQFRYKGIQGLYLSVAC